MADPRTGRIPAPLPVFIGGLVVRVSAYDSQRRAEFFHQFPGSAPGGKLVWQHRSLVGTPADAAAIELPPLLGRTVAWLERSGWPGLDFDHL